MVNQYGSTKRNEINTFHFIFQTPLRGEEEWATLVISFPLPSCPGIRFAHRLATMDQIFGTKQESISHKPIARLHWVQRHAGAECACPREGELAHARYAGGKVGLAFATLTSPGKPKKLWYVSIGSSVTLVDHPDSGY